MHSISNVIEIIDKKHLNSKTNNYIFYGFDSASLYSVVNYSRGRTPVIENFSDIESDVYVVDNKMQNILIDLSDTDIEELLNEILMQTHINERLPFKDIKDILKFKSILRKNRKMLQLIFYNGEDLSREKQILLNDMFWINTYIFNIIYLLREKSHLTTYETPKGYVLDDRENYQRYQIDIHRS